MRRRVATPGSLPSSRGPEKGAEPGGSGGSRDALQRARRRRRVAEEHKQQGSEPGGQGSYTPLAASRKLQIGVQERRDRLAPRPSAAAERGRPIVWHSPPGATRLIEAFDRRPGGRRVSDLRPPLPPPPRPSPARKYNQHRPNSTSPRPPQRPSALERTPTCNKKHGVELSDNITIHCSADPWAPVLGANRVLARVPAPPHRPPRGQFRIQSCMARTDGGPAPATVEQAAAHTSWTTSCTTGPRRRRRPKTMT